MHAGVEALAVAAELVRSADAERVVVVAVDEVGPAAARLGAHPTTAAFSVRSGAVAVLVTARPAEAASRVGRTVLRLGPLGLLEPRAAGHLALSSLADASIPRFVESASPWRQPGQPAWGAYASVDLIPL